MPDGTIPRGFLFDAMDGYLDVRQVPQEFVNEAYAQHVASSPSPSPRKKETMKKKSPITAWMVGAIIGLYALWAFAYDPRTGPADLGDLLVWSTAGAASTTALWALWQGVRRAR